MKFIKLLDEINKDWSVKEKARKLYELIAKNISYDERFVYSKDPNQLEQIYYRPVDIKKEEDPRLICRTINEIYIKLLQELGIKAELIYKNSKIERPIDVNDTALIFWDEQGNKYYTNLVGDIENCRFGLKTKYFGIIKNEYEKAQDVMEITPEELKEIDLKTGYIKTDYSDIVFKLLVEEVKNTNHFKKFLQSQGIDTTKLTRDDILKNKMMYLNKLIKFRDKTAGGDERKKFYQKLFRASAIDKFESEKFNTFEFFKQEEYLSVIELKLETELVYYIYSDEEQTYVQISQEELKEKIEGYQERKGKKLAQEVKSEGR